MMCLRGKSCGAWDWVPSLMYWASLNHWAVLPACEHSGQHVAGSRSSYAPSYHMIVFFSRMEDLTNPEDIRTNIKCDRKVSLYGYLRGAYLKNNSQVHMPGILFCMCWPLGMVLFLWNIEKLSNKAETWSGGLWNSPVVNHLPECWVDADVVWLAGAAACGAFPCQVQPSGASSCECLASWVLSSRRRRFCCQRCQFSPRPLCSSGTAKEALFEWEGEAGLCAAFWSWGCAVWQGCCLCRPRW